MEQSELCPRMYANSISYELPSYMEVRSNITNIRQDTRTVRVWEMGGLDGVVQRLLSFSIRKEPPEN